MIAKSAKFAKSAVVVTAVGVVATLEVPSAQGKQDSALVDALGRTADYVSTYRPKVSGVMLEEFFMLTEIAGSKMRVPRRISSDIVLLNITERLASVRDIYAIDTKPTRERQPRIFGLLKEPTMAAWERVKEISQENAYHFGAEVVLWYSDPVLALRFIEGEHQPRFTYRLEGKKKVNDVQVIGVGFKEVQKPQFTYLLGLPGNPTGSGRIWIDPATGAIHQTELWIQSESDSVRVQVTFAPDANVGGLPLPRQAGHSFETREGPMGTSNMGRGALGRKLAFEANARYSNTRYTPIDLGKITK